VVQIFGAKNMSEENSPSSPIPSTLNHIVGQKLVVEQAQIALDAAFAENEPLPHMICVGPPGLGKTLVAQVLAREMASGLQELLGQSLMCTSDLHAVLLAANDKDIVFIDECEEMEPWLQTTLYKAVEERKIFLESPTPGHVPQAVPLSNFTLILASNHEHELVQPLRDRMKLVLRFDYYSVEELAEILRQRARSLRWAVADEALSLIASRGRGTPRIAIRLMESCRRVTRSEGATSIQPAHVKRACGLEGIDHVGLDRQEIHLLRILNDAGGPVRLNVLASKLGLDSRTIANVFERYLIRQELIQRTAEGRVITPKGMEHLRTQQTQPTERR
jgi:Holliday junction DNA helicase RuvB